MLTALDLDFAHHRVAIGPNDRDASGEISNDGIHEQLLAAVLAVTGIARKEAVGDE